MKGRLQVVAKVKEKTDEVKEEAKEVEVKHPVHQAKRHLRQTVPVQLRRSVVLSARPAQQRLTYGQSIRYRMRDLISLYIFWVMTGSVWMIAANSCPESDPATPAIRDTFSDKEPTHPGQASLN